MMTALGYLETLECSDAKLQREVELLRADAYCELGDGRTALRILSRLAGGDASDPDLLLRAAYARHELSPRKGHESGPLLAAVNRLYQDAGFSLIRRASVTAPATLDNLTCVAPDAEPRERLPLVSVVTWMHDAAERFGLQSLVNQSWKNLEILLLAGEDMLGDLAEYTVADERIRVIAPDGGSAHPLAIGARFATGSFINLHPPGSWAHPERIEAQASALLNTPDEAANVSGHVVVHRDLRPRPLGHAAGPGLVGPHPQSAMLRVDDLTPDELMTVYRTAILAHFNSVSGTLEAPPGVGLVSNRVPLTLSTQYVHATELAPPVPTP